MRKYNISDSELTNRMEASRIFHNILNTIENCNLNYLIQKTPFSAHISLKSSLIKLNNVQTVCSQENEVETVPKTDEHCENVNSELEQQKINLENRLAEEKEEVDHLNKQIETFRDELLKVKKEKHDISSKLKKQEITEELLKADALKSSEEISRLQRKLKENDDLLKVRADENKTSVKVWEIQIVNLKSEITSLKNEKSGESTPQYCPSCVDTFNSRIELSQHVRNNHHTDQVSQTEKVFNSEKISDEKSEFSSTLSIIAVRRVEATDKKIEEVIKDKLALKGVKVLEVYIQRSANGTFSRCDARIEAVQVKLIDETDFQFQNCRVIPLFVNTEEDLKTCDFCGIEFGNLEGLRSHIRSLHREMLPT